MEQKNINSNPMPKFDILPHPLRKLGHAIIGLFRMPHQFASHGDHQFTHPLDEVFDTPPYISEEARMKDYWASIIEIPDSNMKPDSDLHIPPREPFS